MFWLRASRVQKLIIPPAGKFFESYCVSVGRQNGPTKFRWARKRKTDVSIGASETRRGSESDRVSRDGCLRTHGAGHGNIQCEDRIGF